MTTRFSPAGQRVEVLRRMWGSRTALIEDWSGPLRPVFGAFHSLHKRTSEAFPDHDGIVLTRPEAYLSFKGMMRVGGAVGAEAQRSLRATIDRLSERGVLSRGLILRCQACWTIAFVNIDDLGSTNDCRRCRATNALAQAAWGLPLDEPTWWYDLHPSARDLLAADAGVGLLAADYLRRSGRTFVDVGELEFLRDREPVAEADLLAVIDDVVVLGEAKATPTLGSGSERNAKVQKIATMARVVKADQVLLCTSSDRAWAASDIRAVRNAVDAVFDDSIAVPSIRTLTGLGVDATDTLIR